MNKIKVRCWKVNNYRVNTGLPDCLYITYPESNSGHELITCLSCGAVYAVTIAKEVYIGPPLAEKIKNINCSTCGKPLQDNYSSYPETYIVNGKVHFFNRPEEIPSDEESIILEFEGIYD